MFFNPYEWALLLVPLLRPRLPRLSEFENMLLNTRGIVWTISFLMAGNDPQMQPKPASSCPVIIRSAPKSAQVVSTLALKQSVRQPWRLTSWIGIARVARNDRGSVETSNASTIHRTVSFNRLHIPESQFLTQSQQ